MLESEEIFDEEDEYHLFLGRRVSEIECELCSFRAYTVIVSRNWELVDKHVNLFLLQIRSQLQFNGHPSIIIAEIPDTFLRPFGSKRQSRAHPEQH